MAWRIGVDIGGTFTDVAVVDDVSGRIGAAKTLTTPRDFASGVLEALGSALRAYGIAPAEVGFLTAGIKAVADCRLQSDVDQGARDDARCSVGVSR